MKSPPHFNNKNLTHIGKSDVLMVYKNAQMKHTVKIINATPKKKCDTELYLILSVIANPKNDTADNTPNIKANISNPPLKSVS